MSTSAPSKISKSLSMLVAASSLVSLSAMAQVRESSPLGIYGGGTFGIGVAQWPSSDSTISDRAVFSGKFFGGKRLTPGLAAEINYLFFGGLDRANDSAMMAATNVASLRQKERAVTLNINWEVELINDFTNQLRFGWARTRKDQLITYANGSTERKISYDGAPYLGAGIAFQATREVKMLSNFDYIVNGHESYYLFSIGASAEF